MSHSEIQIDSEKFKEVPCFKWHIIRLDKLNDVFCGTKVDFCRVMKEHMRKASLYSQKRNSKYIASHELWNCLEFEIYVLKL